LQEAIIDINKEIALDSITPDNYALRADIYAHLWNYKNGKADIDKAILMDSKVGKYYFIRGLMKLELLDTNQACEDFKIAIALGDSISTLSNPYGRQIKVVNFYGEFCN
jgi:tetratricopeptide (TPR) repeat protein